MEQPGSKGPSNGSTENKTREQSSAGSQTSTQQPVQAATSTPSKAFTGAYIEGGLRVVIGTIDPITGREIRNRQRFDLITNIEVTSVPGHGHFENTQEPYVTLFGQYAPGKTVRLTASSQYYDAVKQLLSGNVENNAPGRPLKTPITVIASGEKMRGFGLMLNGLWVVNPDGSRKTIVEPTGMIHDQAASGSEQSTETAFL